MATMGLLPCMLLGGGMVVLMVGLSASLPKHLPAPVAVPPPLQPSWQLEAMGWRKEGDGWSQTREGRSLTLVPASRGRGRLAVQGGAPGVVVMAAARDVPEPGSTGDPDFDAAWEVRGAASRPDFAHLGFRSAWRELSQHGRAELRDGTLTCLLHAVEPPEGLGKAASALVAVVDAVARPLPLEDIALTDPEPGVRSRALQRLHDVDDVDAPSVASNLRHDRDLQVRITAWGVLGDAERLMEVVRKDGDVQNVAAAAGALSMPEHAQALWVLTQRFPQAVDAVASAVRLDAAEALEPTLVAWLEGVSQEELPERLVDCLLRMSSHEALLLMIRWLPLRRPGRRDPLLATVAAHGSTRLVPALRAAQERMEFEGGRRAVGETIQALQGGAKGLEGALSMVDGVAGGVALAPEIAGAGHVAREPEA